MPANELKKFDVDFEDYMSATAIQRRMLEVQTTALAEISRLEHSPGGLVAAKDIARTALMESVKMSLIEEVQNAAGN